MAVSVRLEPLLEKELELTAKRLGVTKTQFIVTALERALGRKNPYELMKALKLEEEQRAHGPNANATDRATAQAFEGYEQPYDTDNAREQIRAKLEVKHGLRRDR